MKANFKEPKECLTDKNLKATAIRIELLQLIYDFNSAIPFSHIQKKLIDKDRTTIYRTINTLLENGLIHKAHVTDNETFYALCDTCCSKKAHVHNHIHFQCNQCNAVTCENLENEITIALPNFDISKVSINVNGVCKNCN